MAITTKRIMTLIVSSCFIASAALFSMHLGSQDLAPSWQVRHLAMLMMIVHFALSLVDAPRVTFMIIQAKVHGVGNGQAFTASELAVNIGTAIGPYGMKLSPLILTRRDVSNGSTVEVPYTSIQLKQHVRFVGSLNIFPKGN